MGKNLEGSGKSFAMSEVHDLIDEEGLFQQMKEEGNIIMDQGAGGPEEKKRKMRTKT